MIRAPQTIEQIEDSAPEVSKKIGPYPETLIDPNCCADKAMFASLPHCACVGDIPSRVQSRIKFTVYSVLQYDVTDYANRIANFKTPYF